MPYTDFGSSALGSASGSIEDAAEIIAAARLTDLCTIQKPPTEAEDGQGTTTAGMPEIVASDVPCNLYLSHAWRELIEVSASTAIAQWMLEVPLGTDLKPSYQVVKDTITYEVVGTDFGKTDAFVLSAALVLVVGG